MVEKIVGLPYDTTKQAAEYVVDRLRSRNLLPRNALLAHYNYPGPWIPPNGNRAQGVPLCVGYAILHGVTYGQELGTSPIIAQVEAVGRQEHAMTINFMGDVSDHEFIIKLNEKEIPEVEMKRLLESLVPKPAAD